MRTILWGVFVAYCVSISWLYFSSESMPRDCYCVPPIHIPDEQNFNLGKSLQWYEGTTWGSIPTTTTTLITPGPYMYPVDEYIVWCKTDKCHIDILNKQKSKTKEKKITNRVQKCKKYYSDVWCIKGRDWSKCDR